MVNIVADQYQIGSLLGAGAMGDVYQAIDMQTGETVAIKHLKSDLVRHDPDILVRFKREGEALHDLNHPNIVGVVDALEANGEHYIVMEYVSGGDLAQLISETPNGLPLNQALSLALELADALTRAHHLGIIHRDLKPANILLATDGTLRLTDFGVAHLAKEASLTQKGAVVGTYAYLSPEACLGLPPDERADIWTFGVVLFEMLTGQRPFGHQSPGQIINAILNDSFPDPQEIRADISDDLNDLLYRMLDKNRDSRIPSVRLVGAALEAIIRGGATPTTSPPRQPDRSAFATPTPATVERPKYNFPAQTTEFVGRTLELGELTRLLNDKTTRLITILGPGGMGKSRMALETAVRNLEPFNNGAAFVELAPLSDPANIPIAIAEVTDFRFNDQGTPKEQILNYLANKQMLLILDNFEHMLEGRDLVHDILQAAPDVTVLATSRQRLNLSGETIFPLNPLAFPDWETPEDALQYSAVQLFMQSAKRVQIGFDLKKDDLNYLARICRLVEGVPLGILLAAAWVDMLSLAEISIEIQQSIDFLESDLGDLPERQRSMRATFNYSWNLLHEEEQNAFARMSIFRGGCTRQAAQKVTGVSLRMLTALVSKSLLRRDAESGRFYVHELLRQLAEEHLEMMGQATAVHNTHSAYYLDAVAKCEADLKGHNQLRALNTIESDFENIRTAWNWAIDQADLDAIDQALEVLYWFCNIRARVPDGQKLFQQARKKIAISFNPDAHPIQRRLLLCFDATGEDYKTKIEQILALVQEQDNQREIAFFLWMLGVNRYVSHDFTQALVVLKEAFSLYQRYNDAFYASETLHLLGICKRFVGQTEEASTINQQVIKLARESGNKFALGRAVGVQGLIAVLKANSLQAKDYLQEAISVRRELGDWAGIATSLASLSQDAFFESDFSNAKAYAEQSLMIATDINSLLPKTFSLGILSWLASIEENYNKAWELASESLANSPDPNTFVSHLSLAMAACGLENYVAVHEHIQIVLKSGSHWHTVRGMGACLPVLAVLYAKKGEAERAVKVLALAFTHLESVKKWPLIQRLNTNLETNLGSERYKAAWEHGTKLELEPVISEFTSFRWT